MPPKKPPKGWGKSRMIAAKTARSLGAKPYKGGGHEDETYYKGRFVNTFKGLPENVRKAVTTARFGYDYTSEAKYVRRDSNLPLGTRLQNNQLKRDELRKATGGTPNLYWSLYKAKTKGG